MSVPQITEAEIKAALQPFGTSRTLPAAAYVSEEVLEWGREHFFAAGWTCVGRASDVAEGSYRAVGAGNDSLLLSRGPGGELKASSTSVATAATSCCRAARVRPPRSSSARITAGPTGSMGRSKALLISAASPTSMRATTR